MLTFKPGGPTPRLTPDLLKFSRKNFPKETDLRNRMPITHTLRQDVKFGLRIMRLTTFGSKSDALEMRYNSEYFLFDP